MGIPGIPLHKEIHSENVASNLSWQNGIFSNQKSFSFIVILCYLYLLGLQDVLSVVDVNGDKVYFINKLTGQEITKPYTRKLERIWGICMYDDETQPQLKGIILLAKKETPLPDVPFLFYCRTCFSMGDLGVQVSVRSSARSSVRPFVHPSTFTLGVL